MNEGFLGTAAPRSADVVLLLEIGMGVALLIGAGLARMRRFRLHAWVSVRNRTPEPCRHRTDNGSFISR